MDKVFYKVDENRLFQLLAEEAHLNALICGGVDNWDYYGDAINNYIDGYVEEHDDFLTPEEKEMNCDIDITFQDIAAYELIDWERIANDAESDDLGG